MNRPPFSVIASEAKQSRAAKKFWIASAASPPRNDESASTPVTITRLPRSNNPSCRQLSEGGLLIHETDRMPAVSRLD
jgi:hypothetical protein